MSPPTFFSDSQVGLYFHYYSTALLCRMSPAVLSGRFRDDDIGHRLLVSSLCVSHECVISASLYSRVYVHTQQAEDIDAELLTFPSQLEHIGMASR